ncbi:MAG TPA: hypothetical protein VN026_01450, partial [Bacteroidia bacterium]|nr:hypothetical protein [Bacteroidia bacterium]
MRLKIPALLLASFVFSFCTDDKKQELTLPATITWSEHIAPIIFKNCSSCHRPGEAGPFTLLSYSDVVKNENKIKFV